MKEPKNKDIGTHLNIIIDSPIDLLYCTIWDERIDFFVANDHTFMVNDLFTSKLHRVKIQTGTYIYLLAISG